jgi:hypothetical protein
MPLINFRTNLTSLRYGLDQRGGGYSGQPYIQYPIEGPDTPNTFRTLYELNRTSLDFPIRGGAIESLVSGAFNTLAGTIDRNRIQEFFKDAPRGTAFIQKQIGLGLTNPRSQVRNTLQGGLLNIDNAVLPVTQTYNPLNTLAQVQVQGTGIHFNRQGVFPTLSQNEKDTYIYIAGAPQNNTPTTNRLLILKTLKLDAQSGFNPTANDIIATGVDPVTIDRLGISTISNQLFNYEGGPGSVYGIGRTRIFRATNTQPEENVTQNLVYSNIAFTYAQIAEQDPMLLGSVAHPKIQDFRAQLEDDGKTPQVPFSNYEEFSLENKYNIGNPGAYDTRILYNDTSKEAAVDRLNALNPFYFNPGFETPWTAGGRDTNDLIKFAFECLSNDNDEALGNAAAQSAALVFRAFLDGNITDNNRAEYNTFKYLGRGETFRTYQGFDRSLSFSFNIFTQTRTEMLPLYQKLNQLISQVYPDYSPKYNLMRGSVVRLTIGDYIYRTPGFLENVDVTIDNGRTSWEIALAELDEDDVRQLPHLVSVSCTFRPIMDILPRRQTYLSPFVPLIVNGDNYLNPNPPVIDSPLGRSTPVATNADLTAPVSVKVNPNPSVTVAPNKLAGPNQRKVNEAKPKKGRENNGSRRAGDRIGRELAQNIIPPTTIDNTFVRRPIILPPPR